jgi:hypothetical protein
MAYRSSRRRSGYSAPRGRNTRYSRPRVARRPVRRSRVRYGSARTVRIVIEQPGASAARMDQLGIGVKAARAPRKATF